MLWKICLVLLLVYVMISRRKNRKFKKIAEQLPNKMRQFPIFGHAINYGGDSFDRTQAILRTGQEALDHDGVTSLWLGHKFFVVIADPEAADVVMKACLNKDDITNLMKPLLGNGSLIAPVSIWRPRRKFLSLTFSQKSLNNFMRVFAKQSEILMEKLKTAVGKGDFSFLDFTIKYSMDTICETILGLEINNQSIDDHPVSKSFRHICNSVTSRGVKPWLYPDAIYKWHWNYPDFEKTTTFLKEFVAKLVKLKRQRLSQKETTLVDEDKTEYKEDKIKSLLEFLIESGGDKGLSDLVLQEESLVMLTAGTDTSATGMAFAALMLARHPDIQEKLYQEIKQVLGDSRKNIEKDDFPKLKYLDAFIRETLRLYPPAHQIFRKVEKNVTLPSGVTLVPGVGVVIHIWAAHRNQKYWGPDANMFRPERFLEGTLTHPSAFMAFSNGLRNCIGAQFAMLSMKSVLTRLITRYRILPSSKEHKIDNKTELPVVFEVTTKHSGNFQVQIELRN